MTDAAFRKLVLSYWKLRGRHDLPWRKHINPYRVLVSEVMLQQTQVPRVIEKYREFLRAFPSFRALATAPMAGVLRVWQGLGYNRRALMLQRCAQEVTREYGGTLPADYETLRTLPGVGPYTAGAVLAFAFDIPHPMIETNIRRVYIHHFFSGRKEVADTEILPLVERHLGRIASARDWYGALMDYGTHLAQTIPNPNRRSRHHVRQAEFAGSFRQVRGAVVRALAEGKRLTLSQLARRVDDSRLPMVLDALEREGFVSRVHGRLQVHEG